MDQDAPTVQALYGQAPEIQGTFSQAPAIAAIPTYGGVSPGWSAPVTYGTYAPVAYAEGYYPQAVDVHPSPPPPDVTYGGDFDDYGSYVTEDFDDVDDTYYEGSEERVYPATRARYGVWHLAKKYSPRSYFDTYFARKPNPGRPRGKPLKMLLSIYNVCIQSCLPVL